ncbi:MAG TPA: DNA-directed RNA polymerase subunit omega [Terriglobales bacterium]|nr:DNA-directed RNA polymerase subunit omega [Terriglobales bacterium]
MEMHGFDSKYRFILVAARRARQLQSGAPALVKTSSRKASRVAQDEIHAGMVKHVVTELPKTPLTTAADFFDGGSR